MAAERARLRRLNRLERVRALAKQDALRAAAEAERHLAQLTALAERTASLAADYRTRGDCRIGADFRQLQAFASGIAAIGAATARDAARARAEADQRQQELARTERSRAAVADRAAAEARDLTRARQHPSLGTRRALGTALER